VQNYGINPDFDLFLQSKNGGPSPRDVHRWCFRSTMDTRPELAGGGACWRSRAWDLTVAAWGARGADGDPYPRWHELVEGLGRPGVVEGRRRRSKLNEEVIRARG
jgi:hypothetical protein